ncbi:MAG TPA: TRAP transporter small permease [Hydrogenophaga sp.]|uniref:TRAP transporter small permease n=1 Tax=Hydrogenophaga sp. TaxID=1904254 RepID=UPI002C6A2154|nr:TRAP transporter small permease [Hydrogenophaga sp.]HSX93124.1 TRAP transporter small permease [Hydrogenophaga sp.]
MNHPRRASRDPLQGTAPEARQSRFLGASGFGFLTRAAEAVAAALLAVIFLAFILQIVLRYAFDLPVGWTAEISLVAWLWLILWGAAFVLKDEEEIRIDLVQNLFGPRGRRVLGSLGSIATVVLFALALPATWDYVTFMKVESSSYLKIRFDWLYSIYLVFAVAVIARHLWLIANAVRGREAAASTHIGSL